jgi:hypothetical protein
MIRRLRENPTWRQSLLNRVAQQDNEEVFPAIMAALADSDASAATGAGQQLDFAWRLYFNRLVNEGKSQQAYAMWTGLLPAEQMATLGYIFNGSFETEPAGVPFDWSYTAPKGTTVRIEKGGAADGDSALAIVFGGGSINFQNVSQILLLSPGNYRLTGKVRMEDLKTTRGLQWILYCAGTGANSPIGQSPFFSGSSDWDDFSFDAQVPDTGCAAQILRLVLPARIDAERKIQGRIWFDAMAAEKVGHAPEDSNG